MQLTTADPTSTSSLVTHSLLFRPLCQEGRTTKRESSKDAHHCAMCASASSLHFSIASGAGGNRRERARRAASSVPGKAGRVSMAGCRTKRPCQPQTRASIPGMGSGVRDEEAMTCTFCEIAIKVANHLLRADTRKRCPSRNKKDARHLVRAVSIVAAKQNLGRPPRRRRRFNSGVGCEVMCLCLWLTRTTVLSGCQAT